MATKSRKPSLETIYPFPLGRHEAREQVLLALLEVRCLLEVPHVDHGLYLGAEVGDVAAKPDDRIGRIGEQLQQGIYLEAFRLQEAGKVGGLEEPEQRL